MFFPFIRPLLWVATVPPRKSLFRFSSIGHISSCPPSFKSSTHVRSGLIFFFFPGVFLPLFSAEYHYVVRLSGFFFFKLFVSFTPILCSTSLFKLEVQLIFNIRLQQHNISNVLIFRCIAFEISTSFLSI